MTASMRHLATASCDCNFDDRRMTTEEYYRNPYPVLTDLRETCPVHWSSFLNGWTLSRFDDVEWALLTPEIFSSAHNTAQKVERLPAHVRAKAQPLVDLLDGRMVINQDAPRHTRHRKVLSKTLTPARVNALEADVLAFTRNLIEPHRDARQMEFVSEFARPLPGLVLAKLLGVSDGRQSEFIAWGRAVAAFSSAPEGADAERVIDNALRAFGEMGRYVEELIEERRASGEVGEDLISLMVAGEDLENPLSHDEVLATCIQLLFAGHETTTMFLSIALFTLLANPDQLGTLRANPDMMRAAIEEVFRYDSPIVAFPARTATADVDRGGRTIGAGAPVYPIIGAANRDPRVFVEPDVFDVTRKPGRHFGFGVGAHFCVGAVLARLEARIALTEVLEMAPALEATAGLDVLRWNPLFVGRSLESLPIAW